MSKRYVSKRKKERKEQYTTTKNGSSDDRIKKATNWNSMGKGVGTRYLALSGFGKIGNYQSLGMIANRQDPQLV